MISTVILLPLIQEMLLSVTSESMCRKYWLTASQALFYSSIGFIIAGSDKPCTDVLTNIGL